MSQLIRVQAKFLCVSGCLDLFVRETVLYDRISYFLYHAFPFPPFSQLTDNCFDPLIRFLSRLDGCPFLVPSRSSPNWSDFARARVRVSSLLCLLLYELFIEEQALLSLLMCRLQPFAIRTHVHHGSQLS
jgi:hypothetical protein